MERTFAGPQVDIAHLLVPTLWLGMLIGVSFIGTPAKFGAATLSLPVALDVGRTTFALFNWIEWGMLALLVVVVVFSEPLAFASLATVVVALILTLQTTWLLPVLDDRIADIIGGHTRPPASYHIIYIGADIVKGSLLVATAWAQTRNLVGQFQKTT